MHKTIMAGIAKDINNSVIILGRGVPKN